MVTMLPGLQAGTGDQADLGQHDAYLEHAVVAAEVRTGALEGLKCDQRSCQSRAHHSMCFSLLTLLLEDTKP